MPVSYVPKAPERSKLQVRNAQIMEETSCAMNIYELDSL